MRIEDYAIIGNFQTSALVSKHGSIDWLCLPRFDSAACFAALIGKTENGRWQISPDQPYQIKRAYREDTLILDTEFHTDAGVVRLTDFMPPEVSSPSIVRIAKCIKGKVKMKMDLVIRFDYGSITPWVTKSPFGGIRAIAGSDTLRFKTSIPLVGKNMRTEAIFEMCEGDSVPFTMVWTSSTSDQIPSELDNPDELVSTSIIWWREWMSKCTYDGPYKKEVHRSLITLKALTHQKTGGIVAAPTTSLPESIGGVRNWDYRYCWLRDSTLTLYAFLNAGFRDEARSWRNWLLRAAAGTPSELSIMYSLGGERRLYEVELPWLDGFRHSKPVRIGNDAHNQFQLDVYGELMDSFHIARKVGFEHDGVSWKVQKTIIKFLETAWTKPDRGIWEVRGEPQHFVYSKVMVWVAIDRAIQAIEKFHYQGPLHTWKTLRDEIHADICEKGFDKKIGAFTQAYGSQTLDASLLMLSSVGFLPFDDPRILSTVAQIEKNLLRDGFVIRYLNTQTYDGLPGKEGVFLACSLWLADNFILQGRWEEARTLFERVLSVSNDVGLLSEEYDTETKSLLGNFPQGFSHIALINTAFNFMGTKITTMDRCDGKNKHSPARLKAV